MMQKYLGNSIENKIVDCDCGKAECPKVFNNLFKKSIFQNINKYVKAQNFLSTPSMKTFNE